MKISTTFALKYILIPLSIAISFSAFIYLEYFGLTYPIINSLLGLGALYGLLHAPKHSLPIAGFWIGLLWCYWIGYSFEYYGLGWAKWLVSLGFGLVYALYYGILAITSNTLLRAILLFGLTFFWPMDFNWMQPEIIFVESYFGTQKWQFALILFSLSATIWFKEKSKQWIPLLGLLGALHGSYTPPPLPPIDIMLVSTDISQDLKWQANSQTQQINDNITSIMQAITDKKDLVVLPESAFSLYMNEQPVLIDILRELSFSIPILTGTLHSENGHHYNVSYLFDNGHVYIAKKTILVPFGEYIPLPNIIREWINREVFAGGSNFVTADQATDFTIKGIKFRNAICYEATREELYTPDVRYMIAISNNGWFKPSIEPTLQNLLIRFYARNNRTIVFHAANSGGSGIIY